MPSETENQYQNSAPNTQRPLANEIQKKFVDGETLLDFVQKNIRQPSQPTTVGEVIQKDVDQMAEEHRTPINPPAEPAQEPAQEPAAADGEPVPDLTKESEDEDEITHEEDEGDTPIEAEEGDTETDDEGTILKGDAAENFKRLRVKVKELKTESDNKDKLLEELTQELESYTKGEKMPEELARREARITELEHYEKLLNLKKSPYYQDNFVKPIKGIQARLESIAKEYGIDPSKLKQAANFQNEADINRYLSNNFDTVGASEVKKIINDYKGLQKRAVAAEKEPEQALNAMIENAQKVKQEQKLERLEVMQDITRNAWRESLDHIKEEGKVRELIYKEGDVEHNSKVFNPIVQAAATEYGKLVKILVQNGLEELPQPLAYALSRLCQLAHASATAIDSRERAVSMAKALENNTARTQKYIRPSVSGKVDAGRSSRNGSNGPSSPMEAAEQLLQQVRGR